ncbi:MAG: dihydrolipoyl dehydrogenase [Gammaproteobacteria bacterium]|nr:dihydrolipoyl dehydrogenase [Gammaproteobacteria bacterium]
MEKTVDVAIIGVGTSGLNAVSQVKKAGKSFVLINGGHWGTTCARVGCMPSKAFIQVAEDYHRREIFDRHGIEGEEHLTLDQIEGMEHVRDMRDIFVDRVLGSSTDNMPDEVKIEGYAQFIESGAVKVNDTIVRAKSFVIATGTRPIMPEAWKGFGDKVMTTDEFFEQESFPDSMAVIGLGVIGLELGQALSRKGVKVTGIEGSQSIAALSDDVANEIALELMRKEFDIWLGNQATLSESGDKIQVTAGEQTVEVDKVLVAIGRKPNLDNLGLEKLDIPLDDNGLPLFNPNSMQLGDLPIYMAGDVNGSKQILHEAGDEGKIAGFNAAHGSAVTFKRKAPLSITFCDPNIAMIGADWSMLQDNENIVVGEMRLGPVGRALIMGKNKGIMRIYVDKTNAKLLGATLVSVKGEHVAHLLAWSIQQGLTVFDIVRLPFYHPVIEEALQACFYDVLKKLEIQSPDKILELEEMSDE